MNDNSGNNQEADVRGVFIACSFEAMRLGHGRSILSEDTASTFPIDDSRREEIIATWHDSLIKANRP
jgi:hypothetical protein